MFVILFVFCNLLRLFGFVWVIVFLGSVFWMLIIMIFGFCGLLFWLIGLGVVVKLLGGGCVLILLLLFWFWKMKCFEVFDVGEIKGKSLLFWIRDFEIGIEFLGVWGCDGLELIICFRGLILFFILKVLFLDVLWLLLFIVFILFKEGRVGSVGIGRGVVKFVLIFLFIFLKILKFSGGIFLILFLFMVILICFFFCSMKWLFMISDICIEVI